MSWPNICDSIHGMRCDDLGTQSNLIWIEDLNPYLQFMPLAGERSNMAWIKELSSREREVSVLISRGFTNEQIGNKLNISEPTVKTHLRNIYSKIGINDRAQLVSRILKSEADFWNVEYHKLMRRLHQAQGDKNKT